MSSGDGRSRGPTVDHGDVQQHGSSDWWSARDPDSSYVYWFNGETGERLWEAPALDAAGQVASLTGAATAAAAGGEGKHPETAGGVREAEEDDQFDAEALMKDGSLHGGDRSSDGHLCPAGAAPLNGCAPVNRSRRGQSVWYACQVRG